MVAETLAFDVYGTLVDTNGILMALKRLVNIQAELFMNIWRGKQLEYTFRRGLMQSYVDFNICTRQSLEYTCQYLKINLTNDEKERLMQEWDVLPAFSDVKSGLAMLQESNCRMFAFSNGKSENVKRVLQNAGLEHFFEGVVSVDDVKSYKPNPEVYSYFLQKTESPVSKSWLISSNPFDVIGAVSIGMRSVWIKRNPDTIYDPWEIKPTAIVETFIDLSYYLQSANPIK